MLIDALRAAKTDWQILRASLVSFNARRQEFWCSVCRYKDPLGPDGNKLHDDNCPVLALWTSFEELESAVAGDAVDPHATSTGNLSTRDEKF